MTSQADTDALTRLLDHVEHAVEANPEAAGPLATMAFYGSVVTSMSRLVDRLDRIIELLDARS